jgi:hypothetical protein
LRLRRLAAFLPLALLASSVAVTGCRADEDLEPGLEPGAEGIKAVIQTYAKAVADGDGPRACSLMSRTAQEALIQRTGVAGSCLTAVEAIAEPLSEDAKTALADLEVTDINGAETTAASATATVDAPGADEAASALGGTVFTLSVADARWGIDSVRPG